MKRFMLILLDILAIILGLVGTISALNGILFNYDDDFLGGSFCIFIAIVLEIFKLLNRDKKVTTNIPEQLKTYKELLDEKVITKEEYEKAKNKLLKMI